METKECIADFGEYSQHEQHVQVSAHCGCLVGSASVQTSGAELSAETWEQLRHQLQGLHKNRGSNPTGRAPYAIGA